MSYLNLFDRDGEPILGSDGTMYVDGRYNLRTIRYQVQERNSRYHKNFPHKLAYEFTFNNQTKRHKVYEGSSSQDKTFSRSNAKPGG